MTWGEAVFTIVTSVICSMVATYFFWTLSSKAKTTNIVFSPYIERSKREGRYKLRIRFINTGRADLFDVRFIARLIYQPRTREEREGRGTTVYLNVGQRSMSPVLYGKKEQMRRPKEVFSWTSVLARSDSFFGVFSRGYHPENIKEKAKARTLTFDDIKDEYGENFYIQIFVFGIDSMTGIEKAFVSPFYKAGDIVTGCFNSAHTTKEKYKDYIDHILTVNPSKMSE